MTADRKDIKDINAEDIETGEVCDAQMAPEAAEAVMDYLMGHYVTMKKITSQKLEHTLRAITDSKKAVKEAQERDEIKPEYKLLEKLESIEEAIESLVPVDGFMMEELERINGILENLSYIIKTRSDDYIKADQELGDMIDKIKAEEYKETYRNARLVLDRIQDGENLLSGVSEKDYKNPETYNSVIPEAVASGEEEVDLDKGYVVLPSGKKVKAL